MRYAARRRGFLATCLILGFVGGIAFRAVMDDPVERDLANFVRSGLHGAGIAFAGWMVQIGFASNAQSSLGAALRRWPVWAEVLVRSVVMTVTLITIGVALQLALYAEPYQLRWATRHWFETKLPWTVAIGFAISLVVGVMTETARLIGGPMLKTIALGTYHRPVREQLIVMFLDIADSTRLAEELGELRAHDLITRFFFDIDDPISDHGGSVHAYVGDAVIVLWPVSSEPSRNARCLACFLAIERKLARLTIDYDREFDVVPRFRAGLHAGPVIVSECGGVKRQLAYFGDTMNVAARLCDYCKGIDQRLVVSGDLINRVTTPADLCVGDRQRVALRGRQEPIEAYAISPSFVSLGSG
jgi:class 3 adenylate cyclase